MATCQSLDAFAHALSLRSDGTEKEESNKINYGGVVNFLLVSEFNCVRVRVVVE